MLYIRLLEHLLLCFIGCIVISSVCKSNLEIILEGLESELECSVRKQVDNIDFNARYMDSEFQTQLDRAIKLGLRPLGYYNPKIEIVSSVKTMPGKLFDTVVVKITPGHPIRIVDIDLNIYGDGKYDVDYQRIIKDSRLFIGERLKHCDYKELKNKLYSLAISKGYFDAKFRNSQLIVVPSLYQCIWKINFDSGDRYMFEEIKFQNSQIQDSYLNNISNIHAGEYYDIKSIMELNRRLFSTNWFESVSISTDFIKYIQKKKLILNVLLTPKVKNSFEIGSGYNSDTGPRSKIVWKKSWVNSNGHSLENNFSLSALEQYIDISYKIPLLCNPLKQYYLLQGGYMHEDVYDFRSKVITLNISRYWNYSNSWRRVINLYWYMDCHVQNNDVLKTMILICPGISINRIHQHGSKIPYWGHSQRYSINISSNYWKSNINFIILQAQNVWIKKLFKKHRILVRNNLSWMETDNLSFIIPKFQFLFTKDRSIRGYDNKFLFCDHFKDITKTAIKLITNAFEYQYNIFEKWWVVMFIDIGEITSSVRWENFKIGTGIGMHWQSPVGPVKLDMAIPLIHKSKKNHRFLHFYVDLGPEL